MLELAKFSERFLKCQFRTNCYIDYIVPKRQYEFNNVNGLKKDLGKFMDCSSVKNFKGKLYRFRVDSSILKLVKGTSLCHTWWTN